MSTVMCFPGQGAQTPDMLDALPDRPAVRRTRLEAGRQLTALGRTRDVDSEHALRDTTGAQLGLLVVEVAAARLLAEEYDVMPDYVAGHSVGGFAAAVTAGAVTFAEAIALVARRGELMRQACAKGSWGMAAVTGLTATAVTDVTRAVSAPADPLWVAAVNGASEIVVAGTSTALQRAVDAVRTAGARNFQPLDVTVASHGPIQHRTATELASMMAVLPRRAMTAGYLTNVGGRRVDGAAAVLDDLAWSVAHPVQWFDAVRLGAELGATFFVETPPGHVLTRLIHATVPGVVAVALADSNFPAMALLHGRSSTRTR